jgi:hypothetical protein
MASIRPTHDAQETGEAKVIYILDTDFQKIPALKVEDWTKP